MNAFDSARRIAQDIAARASALVRVTDRELREKRKRDARPTGPPVLSARETCWIFLSDSVDPRHLFDIVWAVDSLRARGCPESAIIVYTAQPTVAKVVLGSYGIEPKDLANVRAELAALAGYRFAVLTIGGHGTPTGIGANLSPAHILAALRTVPKIEVGVAVLSQCFAGSFHFIDAKIEPPLVVIGATNLSLSVSMPIRLKNALKQTDGTDGLQDWSANIFMLKFFEWLRAPSDVDGDGVVNLVDAFKYAGVASSNELTAVKAGLFVQANRLSSDFLQLQKTGAPALDVDAVRIRLQQTLQSLHVHQEPWILHADLARSLRF